MKVDEFWDLIEASRRAGSKRDEREAFLRERRGAHPALICSTLWMCVGLTVTRPTMERDLSTSRA
ncbi:hypothetical protein GCM10023176_33560 [Micromonospora coerulea]|uniref:DUF4240 domain-containing protein n=1 Tax=Micromonospora coerulea TaxID=47856 RepID=A0ABP8SNK1_9ACTN